MSREWTKEQRLAKDADEGRFLVSAGAGSGKTAVLTERIHRLVIEGRCALSELLVLTFTNKAAHEMKERVRHLFLADKNPVLADEVEAADITTFDAFALSLVKKYHFDLELPADVAILDEKILEVEERKILDEILSSHYRNPDADFLDFVRHFAIKDDDEIVRMTLSVFHQAELSEDKEAFFLDCEEAHYSPAFFEKGLSRYFQNGMETLSALLSAASRYENGDLAEKEIAFLTPLRQSSSYDALLAAVQLAAYPSLRGYASDEVNVYDKALHKALAAVYKDLQNDLKLLGDSETQKSRYFLTKPYAHLWLNLAKELDQRLADFKKEKGTYSFADIAYFARKAAKMPRVNAELKKRYRFLMVDEYQDTSNLQQSFLNALNDGNFFAVGDIKQSIYRFRNADPTIFLSVQNDCTLSHHGSLITLKDNFRSRKEVVADINSLFSKAMSVSLGGVSYDESQALTFGNKALYGESDDAIYHSETLVYSSPEGLSSAECEARIIAADIQKKIQSRFQLAANTKENPARDATYADFAILISRKKDFPIYQKVFSLAKIPLSVSDDSDLSDEDVSLAVLSALRLVSAIGKDENETKHDYVSLSRSYLFREKDADIYEALENGSYQNAPFLSLFRTQRNNLLRGSCENGIRFLFKALPFFESLPAIGDVKDNFRRLSSFLLQAKAADRLGKGFEEFISGFKEMASYDIHLSMGGSSDGGSSVKLMSIHASKGLEFPVVYSPDMNAKANLSDASSRLLFSKTFGFLIPLTLEDGNPLNLFHSLNGQAEIDDALSERLRLYYVALTRAKEKIVFVQKKADDETFFRLDDRHLLKMKAKENAEGDESVSASFIQPKTFAEFNALAGFSSMTQTAVAVPEVSPVSGASSSMAAFPCPTFRSIHVDSAESEPIRASKDVLSRVDEGALAYGDYLHRLLELTDFAKKDLSFIEDVSAKQILSRVLSMPLFENCDEAKIYQEYSFFDETNNLHGSIDLLMVYPDKCVIVDYKTKDIDDPAYDKQVGLYRAYIERAFARKTETYLLSLIEGKLKKVQ